jgi:hypothetical protein
MTRPLPSSRAVAWLATTIASLPTILSVGIAIARGEWMAGDRSIMGVFTRDVLSANPPLLGTVSTLGNYTEGGTVVHHLGPAQFYALAPIDWLASGHPAGLLLGGMAVNLVAIAVAVRAAQRRLGDLGAAGIALTSVGLSFGLGPALLRDIWTPHLGLWPLFALFLLTWSLLDGDVWALPWAAAMASFLAQIELLFVGPTIVLVLAGVLGLARHRWTHRGADQPPLLRPLLWSTAVSVVMWLPVAIQELRGEPGNLSLLIDSLGGQEDRAGWSFVWGNLVGQLQLPPVWLRRATSPYDVGSDPSPAAIASAVLVGLLLLVLTIRAVRWRAERPTVASLLLTTWAVLLGAVLNLSIVPADGTIGLQYRRWMWPAGAVVWFAIAVAVTAAGADRLRASGRIADPERLWARARPAAYGLLAIALLACIPASLGQHTPLPDDLATNEVVESAWDPFIDRLPRQPTYVQLSGAKAAFAVGPEVIRRLIVHGFDVQVPEAFSASFGEHRVFDPRHPTPQGVAVISDEGTLAPPSPPAGILAFGRIDGRSGEAFTAEVAPLLERVRTSGPFVFDGAGILLLTEAYIGESPDPRASAEALLTQPTKAMFAETVLRLQLDGRALSSPLTDDEARRLLTQLDEMRVAIYLMPAPLAGS